MGFSILLLTLIGIFIAITLGSLMFLVEKKLGSKESTKYLYWCIFVAAGVYITTQFFIGEAAILPALGSWIIIMVIALRTQKKPQ